MSASKNKTKHAKTKTGPSARSGALPLWFESHFRWLSVSVLVFAGLLRLGLLLEFPNMPFSQIHTSNELDMQFFDAWGDRIAEGDIWTDTTWHPYHFWHKEIAKNLGIENEADGKQLWAEWYGGKRYHQEPLYPLIIGMAKLISGHALLLIYILQMILGLCSIWLIIWLGRHYFGAMASIASGLLFALYSPGLLFDVVLLRTSLSTCLLLSMLYVAEKLIQGKSKPWIMGLLGGTGYLLISSSMLLWIPLTFRWLWKRKEDLKKSWQVALGFGIILSFLVIRNVRTETPILSASSVGPITYVLSNFPNYPPESGFVFIADVAPILETTGGRMIPSALAVIRMHDSVWDWMWLQFKKLGFVFHWYEIPNNVNTYLARQFSLPLQIAFIPYSLIAALGIAGMGLNLKNKKVINLHIAILSQIAVMAIFYVLCRFRVPMVAMLTIFAGYTLQEILRITSLRQSIILLLLTVGLWMVILRPFPKLPNLFFKTDVATYFTTYYLPKLDHFVAQGDLKSCALLFEELLTSMPDPIRNVDPQKGLSSTEEKKLAYYYGTIYNDLGDLYRDIGQTSQANTCYAQSKLLKSVGLE